MEIDGPPLAAGTRLATVLMDIPPALIAQMQRQYRFQGASSGENPAFAANAGRYQPEGR